MIELLVVISIAAILAMIAIPSFRDMLNTTRLNSALGLVTSDLNQARGEAIKRNSRVLVCVRSSATQCVISAGTDIDWQAGWLVCSEGAVANQCAAGTALNPNPLLVRPPLDANLTLRATTAAVRFSPNSSAATATLTLRGTWTGAPTRTIAVAGTGNISR